MAKVVEEVERSSVGCDVGLGRAVAEELDVYIIFIYEDEEIFESVYRGFWVTSSCVDMDCILSTIEGAYVKFVACIFGRVEEIRGGDRRLF